MVAYRLLNDHKIMYIWYILINASVPMETYILQNSFHQSTLLFAFCLSVSLEHIYTWSFKGNLSLSSALKDKLNASNGI